ncbi:MAG: DUF2201 family putative metallopeptidase [Acidimicrobiales bacterium]
MTDRSRPGGIAGLAASRLWAAAHFPYLASGLFALQVVEAPGIGTVAVDEGWRLWVDPTVAAGWTSAQLGSVLVHHACHLLRSHGDRAREMEVGNEEAGTWVRCADAEINDDMIPGGLELPGTPVQPHHLGAVPGRLAEHYFEIVRATEAPRTTGGATRVDGPPDWSLDWQRGRWAGQILGEARVGCS